MVDEKLTANVQLDALGGKLRNLPLSGSGTAEINDKRLFIDDLNLEFGSAHSQLNGSADPEKQFDLSFQAGAKDVAMREVKSYCS